MMPDTVEDMKRKIDKRLMSFAADGRFPAADDAFWRGWADELFMEPYRGNPCIVCERTHSRKTITNKKSGKSSVVEYRSGFHHLIPKNGCIIHRYTKRNGAVLCPWHHTDSPKLSPHYEHSAMANHRFWLLIMERDRDLYDWVVDHEKDTFESFGMKRCWTYRDALIYQYHKSFRELPNVKPKAIEAARKWQSFFAKGE